MPQQISPPRATSLQFLSRQSLASFLALSFPPTTSVHHPSFRPHCHLAPLPSPRSSTHLLSFCMIPRVLLEQNTNALENGDRIGRRSSRVSTHCWHTRNGLCLNACFRSARINLIACEKCSNTVQGRKVRGGCRERVLTGWGRSRSCSYRPTGRKMAFLR